MKKIRLNLTTEILSCVILPILLLVIFSILSINSVGTLMADRLREDHMETSNHAIKQILNLVNTEDFHLEGDELYRGSVNLTTDNELLDSFKKESGVEVTIFYGMTRRATTIVGSNGKRILGTKMSDEVYRQIKANKSYFSTNVLVEGEPYYGMYKLIADYGEGKEVILFTGVSVETTHSIYTSRLNANAIFMIAIAVASLVLAFLIMRSIVRSIKSSVLNLNEVAEGKLNFTLDKKMTSRGDDVGTIARAIDSLMKKFIEIVHNLRGSSDTLTEFTGSIRANFATINKSIADINTAVEEIAGGATNQANETQEVASQMNDMGLAVDKASKNIVTLKKSAEGMEASNHEVSETLDELVTISTSTRESVEIVQQQTNDTNQSVMEIQNAVALISDIAGQTNLLSLNASIEAARAGEQGKGFAVVADEVRKLAEQSKQSAEQIEVIVRQLIEKSNSSVYAMNTVMQEIQSQYDKLNQTKNVFGQLNLEIANVTDAVDGIAGEIENINHSKNVVYNSLESLAAISEENAASTEETSATMAQLRELVNECDNSVGKLGTISDALEQNINRFTL
ncbi:MAG: methyl-accepting chemotaxis protein [Lachnospiraceae bacterium]|nr:methyl-accepting chemotaxis protein [Lachnospiraceae bacterium]